MMELVFWFFVLGATALAVMMFRDGLKVRRETIPPEATPSPSPGAHSLAIDQEEFVTRLAEVHHAIRRDTAAAVFAFLYTSVMEDSMYHARATKISPQLRARILESAAVNGLETL